MALTYDSVVSYGGLSYDSPVVVSVLVYSPAAVYLAPTGTGPQGTLVPPPTASTPLVGEAMIRDAIKKLMLATNAFDDVWIGSKLDWGKRPNVAKGGSVQPISTQLQQGYDFGETAPAIYRTDIRVGIYVRNEDSELRDAIAQRLLQQVDNATYHVSLASLTVPEMTALKHWSWHEAKDVSPPAREIEAHLFCDWLYGF